MPCQRFGAIGGQVPQDGQPPATFGGGSLGAIATNTCPDCGAITELLLGEVRCSNCGWCSLASLTESQKRRICQICAALLREASRRGDRAVVDYVEKLAQRVQAP